METFSALLAIYAENSSTGGNSHVSWWRHEIENFPCYWPSVRRIHRSPVNSPHKGQWRGALMFSLIYAWINGWVNNREAGDLRRHRAHYDVTVMTNIKTRDHSGYGFSQWQSTLQCNAVFHWQSPYPEKSLKTVLNHNKTRQAQLMCIFTAMYHTAFFVMIWSTRCGFVYLVYIFGV